jgi:hypothetical protein
MGWFDSIGDFVSEAVGWVGDNADDILDLGGTAVEYMGTQREKGAVEDIARKQRDEVMRVAGFNAALLRENADVSILEGMSIQHQTDLAFVRNIENTEKLLSAQRARYAKSGVAVGKGTPVDVMNQTAVNAAKDRMMIKYNGDTARNRAYDLARKYRASADETMRSAIVHADIIDEAMKDDLDTIEYQQWATGLQTAASLGIKYGIV